MALPDIGPAAGAKLGMARLDPAQARLAIELDHDARLLQIVIGAADLIVVIPPDRRTLAFAQHPGNHDVEVPVVRRRLDAVDHRCADIAARADQARDEVPARLGKRNSDDRYRAGGGDHNDRIEEPIHVRCGRDTRQRQVSGRISRASKGELSANRWLRGAALSPPATRVKGTKVAVMSLIVLSAPMG